VIWVNNIERHSIIVEGMSCEHCKKAVEEAVKSLSGVLAAEVDLGTKTLTVEFNSDGEMLTKIKEAVDEEGYTAL